jgi:CheY-like chemotaxis protein
VLKRWHWLSNTTWSKDQGGPRPQTRKNTSPLKRLLSPPRPGALGEILLYPERVKEITLQLMEPSHQVSGNHIQVLIVDGQAAVRSGLRYVLLAFDDFEPIAEAATAQEALALCAEFEPDVVLMDVLIPGADAAGVTHTIRQRFPQTQVIALTSFGAENTVQAVLEAGAIGHLLKNVSAEELADAIRSAHAGRLSTWSLD